VGSTYGTATHQLVAHWNGKRWTRVRLAAGDWLNDVGATGANDVWAVGNWDAIHWNGRGWKRTLLPHKDLAGVAAISGRNVWAVGSGHRGPTILRYACR